MPDEFTHLNEDGQAHMVDVAGKDVTLREATAVSRLLLEATTLDRVLEGSMDKGDVFATARIAGIMAAKRTHELIPLCHPLQITHAEVVLEGRSTDGKGEIEITATVRTKGRTGVEMEALTACSIAALTVYDMCKSVDRAMVVGETYLVAKSGGRSGRFSHPKAHVRDG